MTVILTLLAATIAWAVYQYVHFERSNRASWTAAPLPRLAIADGPYRSTSVERRLVSAPLAVKAAAFMCFFVGPGFALVVLVPAWILARGPRLVSGGPPAGSVDLALTVYRLGRQFLARDCRSDFDRDAATRLLRIGGGALGVFVAFGLTRGAADQFFTGLGIFAGVLLLTSLLLAHANRLHGARFADPVSDAGGDPPP